ncbi:sugar transporter [Paenibacillus darwinianus]|uniref:Sugar transporter n=1 Tax=Paenibacillus darwinianus TaxID=1380763 RepID=A0A9W5S3A3_9BACL|nr:extracellular solute-binding protein [Paenibacillus darwinianus]EXX90388.1 sugar transporter [Paenibacillus darwinianus]EXX91092.1 sugar transporter [Paenibacillus darwinianus]EXX91966.1 sugar transporter [Paenibacillus darwinianus]
MKRRFGFLVAAVLVLSMMLSACSGGNSNNGGANEAANGGSENNGAPAAGEKITLSYWTLFSGGDGENMDALIAEFNKTHPNIEIKNTKLEWAEYYTKLITAVGNGNGPDIGISHVTGLDDVADAAGVDWGTYNENLLNATVVDGKHYAVPIDTHPLIMYYNKKLLRDAGLLGEDGKPVLEQSADGFTTFLSTLKEKLPSSVTPFAFESKDQDPYRLWWSLYKQQGGNDVISEDQKSAEIDADKAAKAAGYIQDLYVKGFIKKNDPDFYKTFQSGAGAITMTGVWATGTWESTKGLEFGAMPIPKIFDQEATWGDSHTIVLPVTKDEDPAKRQAALTFANWVADNGQIWAKAGHIPSKPAVIEKQEFKDMPYRSDYVAVADTVAFGNPSTKSWQIRDLAIVKYLNEVWANKMTPADAIAKMQPEIQKVIDQ